VRIQLISKENGYGLSRDVEVMRSILEPLGHEVHFTNWEHGRKVQKHHYDANVFLELLNPALYFQARVNYLFPNPEWFMPTWVRHLGGIDLVLAKTHDAQRIFSQYTSTSTEYTGFTSPDLWDGREKRNAVLHLVGKSIAKGTQQVREAAAQLPDVEFVFGSGTDVRELQRSCSVHCQPSTYEGFGHCINEGKSCGAVVITTAAEPMTELVTPAFGYGVNVCGSRPDKFIGKAIHREPCVDSLVEAIRDAHERDDKSQLGEKARASYLEGREAFTTKIKSLFP
jgi:hypothetical protein